MSVLLVVTGLLFSALGLYVKDNYLLFVDKVQSSAPAAKRPASRYFIICATGHTFDYWRSEKRSCVICTHNEYCTNHDFSGWVMNDPENSDDNSKAECAKSVGMWKPSAS